MPDHYTDILLGPDPSSDREALTCQIQLVADMRDLWHMIGQAVEESESGVSLTDAEVRALRDRIRAAARKR